MTQGDLWWADLPEPTGSGPGYRRPVVVVQGDAYNQSRLATVVCVALTTNLRWAGMRGNVLVPAGVGGLPRDSVVNVSQVYTLDRGCLTELLGRLPAAQVQAVLAGLDVMLGR